MWILHPPSFEKDTQCTLYASECKSSYLCGVENKNLTKLYNKTKLSNDATSQHNHCNKCIYFFQLPPISSHCTGLLFLFVFLFFFARAAIHLHSFTYSYKSRTILGFTAYWYDLSVTAGWMTTAGFQYPRSWKRIVCPSCSDDIGLADLS